MGQKPAKKLHWLGQLRQKQEQKLAAICKHTSRKHGDASGASIHLESNLLSSSAPGGAVPCLSISCAMLSVH